MKLRDFGAIILLGSIWGASYLFIKLGVAVIPPATFVLGRVVIAGLVSLAIMKARRIPLPNTRAVWATFAVMGLLNGAIPYTLITWGEQVIDSGLAAILIAAVPIFTVIFAWFFLPEERLTFTKGMGIVLGFLGVAVLIGPDALAGAHNNVLGDLAVVGAAASYGAAFVWARLRLRGVPPMAATTSQMAMATLWMLPLTLLVDRPWQLHFAPTPATWVALGSLLTLAVLGTSLAYVLYYWLVAEVGATQASLVTYISPFISLVWGALFLGEHLTLAAFVGFGLILLGLALINGFAIAVARRLVARGAHDF